MRNVFSRRDFLKASAAAVLAASAAGVLTGCDGGGEQLAENEAILGDFKIKGDECDNKSAYNRCWRKMRKTCNGSSRLSKFRTTVKA